MRQTIETTQIREGCDVYGSDDQRIGTVAEVGDGYFVLEKGLLLPKDIYVPLTAVTSASTDQIVLNVPKNQIDSMGWDEPPTDTSSYDTASSDATSSGTWRQEQRVPVHEEELEARTTPRQTGQVNVRKNVVEDEESMDVPVNREEVQVRRVPADRDASGDTGAFRDDGQTIRVPVTEEQVEVTKRPRVVEEVEISKVGRQDTQRVSDTVRREQVDVSSEGNPRVRNDQTDRG